MCHPHRPTDFSVGKLGVLLAVGFDCATIMLRSIGSRYMPVDRISKIYIGAADGKFEYPADSNPSHPQSETFVWPKTVNEAELLSGRIFLIRGFRGTGKTSLLRWLATKLKEQGHVGRIVLFKTDLSEARRVEISKAVGIKEIIELDSRKMGISEDFKEYELSATYSPEEVSAIESLFIAQEPFFGLFDFSQRLRQIAKGGRVAERLLHERGGVHSLLRNLYRIGAIGNSANSGSIVRQRWVFRGDPHLDLESRMRLHPAFASHLSVRHTKKVPQRVKVGASKGK
jgi:hypothetical protein